MSLVVAAGGTILVALFLTPLFHNLPEATLAAIVVVAVAGMMNVKEMLRPARLRRQDFALSLTALLGVLVFDALVGLLIAVVASLGALILRASRPGLSVLGLGRGTHGLSDLQLDPEARQVPGLLIVRPNEELFFANAPDLVRDIVRVVEAEAAPVQTVLLNLELTLELDVAALDALDKLAERCEHLDTRLVVARAHRGVRQLAERAGPIAWQIAPSVIDGIVDHLAKYGSERDQQVAVVEALRALEADLAAFTDQAGTDGSGSLERLRYGIATLADASAASEDPSRR